MSAPNSLGRAALLLACMPLGLLHAEETSITSPELEPVTSLLTHKLSNRIVVRRQFDARPELFCSPSLLNQVVMNIVGNAADAIEDQGAITIATRESDGQYVIEIADTGPGVPEDIRENIFDPFVTTKPSGTGLGLALVAKIVGDHGGVIECESQPGHTAFRVLMPAWTEAMDKITTSPRSTD